MYSREITTMVVCAALLPPLLAACSTDDEQLGNGGETQQEIRIDVGASNYVEVTRATTYEPGSTLESMMLGTNLQGTSTVYFAPELVSYADNVWTFDGGTRYWPMSSALDFYAYMPATLPSYISNVAYDGSDDGSDMSFTCTGLPVTAAAQGSSLKEFVCAVTKNVAQSTSSGTVSLAMQHPFARICLRWASDYDHSDITVNSITLKNIKNNGTVTFDGSTATWTPTGDVTNFVATALDDNDAATLNSYLVVPQTFAGVIEVNATWKEWDHDVNHTVSTTLASPTTWAAGSSYTYDFTITQTDLKVTTTTNPTETEFAEQW